MNFCTAAKLLWRAWRFVCFYKYAGLSGYTKQWLWCAMCDNFNLWSLIENGWVYSFDITDWGSGCIWWQRLKFGITIEAVVLRIMSKTDSFALKNTELWGCRTDSSTPFVKLQTWMKLHRQRLKVDLVNDTVITVTLIQISKQQSATCTTSASSSQNMWPASTPCWQSLFLNVLYKSRYSSKLFMLLSTQQSSFLRQYTHIVEHHVRYLWLIIICHCKIVCEIIKNTAVKYWDAPILITVWCMGASVPC